MLNCVGLKNYGGGVVTRISTLPYKNPGDNPEGSNQKPSFRRTKFHGSLLLKTQKPCSLSWTMSDVQRSLIASPRLCTVCELIHKIDHLIGKFIIIKVSGVVIG